VSPHGRAVHIVSDAYYAQELDYVRMAPFAAFRDAESYYSTLAQELTHWTKLQRLDRDFGRKSWGPRFCALTSNYARNDGKRMPPILPPGWGFSRVTAAPFLRQPHMPSEQPIISIR
jgi:hypothetical protein